MNVHQNGSEVNVTPILRRARRATGRVSPNAKTFRQTTAAATTPVKPPSLSKQFADTLLTGKDWAAVASHTSGGETVYHWNGKYWEFVGTEDGATKACSWMDVAAPDKASDDASKNAWKYASRRLRATRPLPTGNDGRVIIPCADVYLEVLKDGRIVASEPDRSLGLTHGLKLDAGTPPGKDHQLKELPPTSAFRKWMEHAQPDPTVRALIQEQAGMMLLPGVYSIAVWWYGAAGSGKSMLAELCEAMQRQASRIQFDQLSTPFGLEALVGASMVLVDEVEQEKWGEALWKSLVSGNGVGVARKFQTPLLSYHSKAKWLICSNPKPYVRDKSNGVWRRLDVVEWSVCVPEHEQVERYHEKLLSDEGGLILDWMLEGARRIVQRGRYMPESERPLAAREAKMAARENSDSVLAWMNDVHVRIDRTVWSPVKNIYTAYLNWCTTMMRDPLDTTPFFRALHASSLLNGLPKKTPNRRIAGAQTRCLPIDWDRVVRITDDDGDSSPPVYSVPAPTEFVNDASLNLPDY